VFEHVTALAIDPSGSAHGRAEVPADHPLFADHFPGRPVLPGSSLIELMAQVAGPLAEELALERQGVERWAVLGQVRHATFRVPVALPARVDLEARVERLEPSSAVVRASASAGGETRARAELVFSLQDPGPEWGDAVRERRERVARWKAAW